VNSGRKTATSDFQASFEVFEKLYTIKSSVEIETIGSLIVRGQDYKMDTSKLLS